MILTNMDQIVMNLLLLFWTELKLSEIAGYAARPIRELCRSSIIECEGAISLLFGACGEGVTALALDPICAEFVPECSARIFCLWPYDMGDQGEY